MTWDLLPGFLVTLNQDNEDDTAWGMTCSSRLAIYDIISQSAIVAEVFGGAGFEILFRWLQVLRNPWGQSN